MNKNIDLLLVIDLISKLYRYFRKRQRKANHETPLDVPLELKTNIP